MANIKKTHKEFVRGYSKKYPNINVISPYSGIREPITLQCNTCGHIWTKKACFAYGCPNCENIRKKQTNTHEQYLEKLKERNITDTIPVEKYIKAQVKILHKCLKCDYEWSVKPNNILNGYGCPLCAGSIIVKGVNDLWTVKPDLAKMLLNTKDGYKYGQGSDIKLDWVCPECHSIVKGKFPYNVNKFGLNCRKCNDGNSTPNKFIANVLDYLHIDFESEKTFEWSNNKRYDAYIDSLSCIIEMHGNGHYTGDFEYLGGRNLEQEKENDLEKYNLAIQNGIRHYIIVDCQSSSLEWMKKSIINSDLSKLININDIDWDFCYKNSLKSQVILASNLWNQGHKVDDVAKIMHLSNVTVCTYLRKANSIGMCKYLGVKNKFKKVICVNTGEIFEAIKNAKSYYNAYHIGDCCNGKRPHAGLHPITKEKLVWKFYDEYIKEKQTFSNILESVS